MIEQHQLECALLGLGQFQNNFDELHAWITHTAELLQASRPISIDLQTCEIELAKHKVYAVYTVFFIAVVLKVNPPEYIKHRQVFLRQVTLYFSRLGKDILIVLCAGTAQ